MRKLFLTLAAAAMVLACDCIVTTPPPPGPPVARVAITPQPYPDAVWIPGCWKWKWWLNKYVWAPGYWVEHRDGKEIIIP